MIALPAEVTFATAVAALEGAARALDEGARGGAPLEVDLAGCRVADSSLLGVLLELARRAAAAGAAIRFHGPSDNVRKLAALYGIDELLFAGGDASPLASPSPAGALAGAVAASPVR